MCLRLFPIPFDLCSIDWTKHSHPNPDKNCQDLDVSKTMLSHILQLTQKECCVSQPLCWRQKVENK